MTETLAALGVASNLVGITSYCLFPPGLLTQAARVGGTKTPRIERIRELEPDLVHVNLEENLEPHAREIGVFAPVFASEPRTVADVRALLLDLGLLHGALTEAEALVRELDGAADAVRDRPAFRFAVPIWKKPWMWCGGDTYVSNLVCSAGGVNILEDLARYPELPVGDVLARKPDVIFLPDEPWEFTAEDAASMRSRDVQVVGPFPGHLFTWHGVRTIEGLAFLREQKLKS